MEVIERAIAKLKDVFTTNVIFYSADTLRNSGSIVQINENISTATRRKYFEGQGRIVDNWQKRQQTKVIANFLSNKTTTTHSLRV